jgi:glutamate carboxypeptidase
MKKQYTILMIGLTLICTGYANGLTKTEKKIRNYVEKHSDEAINLLEKVVNINSGSLNIEGN